MNRLELLILDNAEPGDTFNADLADFTASALDCTPTLVNYTQMPAHHDIKARFDAVLISGVPMDYSSDSVEQRLAAYSWLKKTNVPTLGICLGHQLMARVFGADMVHSAVPEVGSLATTLNLDESYSVDPLFTGIASAADPSFETYLMHYDSVDVPPKFRGLARSALCSNVVMRHRKRLLYGLQGHPELSPQGDNLLANFGQLALQAAERRQATTASSIQAIIEAHLPAPLATPELETV